jgi:glycosyltransferase involved in cell wall biosynthesis
MGLACSGCEWVVLFLARRFLCLERYIGPPLSANATWASNQPLRCQSHHTGGIMNASKASSRRFEPIGLPTLPDRPLVSVLIPNYNYARFVGMALQSVLNQTYQTFEALVCDDGSIDNSREVIHEYVRKDSRIRLLAQANRGFASAVNTAYENSKGEVICLLDADDMFKPPKLQRLLEAFRSNARSGLCVHPLLPVSAAGQPLGPPSRPDMDCGWIGPQALERGGWSILPSTSSLTFRRQITAEIFPIPRQIGRFVDYYLSRTAQFFTEISIVPEPLTEYRIHGKSMSGISVAAARSALNSTDPHVLQQYVEDFEEVLPVQKEFLKRFYGPAIADALRLKDHPRYWDDLLALRALRGRRDGAIRHFSVPEMINHVRQPRYRMIWRAIMLLPAPLAKRAYRFWRTPSRTKAFVKSVARPLLSRVKAHCDEGEW